MSNAVAIIGLAGRFPGARDVEAFWRNLDAGTESIRTLTRDDLRAAGVPAATADDRQFVPAAAVMDDIETFDAAFFGYSPADARLMDPQHRVFLECAWAALEDAGYDSERSGLSIGVFGGATINTYLLTHVAANRALLDSLDLAQINIASGVDFLTSRVSYKLNLTGPSHVVQSACSTSLVAVHVACQNLLDGTCDMALAGGVSVNVSLRHGYRYREGGMTSPDGHCRAFDAAAQGTVFGSGVGVAVLRRLEDAQAAGDTIHAVILGSAINNDGAQKVGYTAPGVDGQAAVIAEALANADVPAESIAYIEAHGTGTALGDPIELRALTKAYRAQTARVGYCAVGSVKGNIGHLDAAAGVAGLIKTVLMLRHGVVPATVHLTTPNPRIAWNESPFYAASTRQSWPAGPTPRRAGVSSFGVGGTNAHVIVEDAPPAAVSAPGRSWQLLMLSARTEAALTEMTMVLADRLSGASPPALADVAFTLQEGRRVWPHRRVCVSGDATSAAVALRTVLPADGWRGHHDGAARRAAFVFPAEGRIRVGQTRELHASEPAFRDAMSRAARAAAPSLGIDLRTLLYANEHDAAAAQQRLDDIACQQPALFALEYALAMMWRAWGVQPDALFGHGVGEYVAACVADVFPLDVGMRLAIARGRVPQRTTRLKHADADADAPLDPNAPRTLEALMADPQRVVIELGPGTALTTQVRAYCDERGSRLAWAGLPDGDSISEQRYALDVLGQLWLAGVEMERAQLFAGERRRRVSLPTYPFERQRFWIDPPRPSSDLDRVVAMPAPATHPRPDLRTPYVPPANPRESQVAAIWEAVLGIAPLGMDDNFFELGGDSLLATQLAAQLQLRLGTSLPASALYEGLTVRLLTRLLDSEAAAARGHEPAATVDSESTTDRRQRVAQMRRQRTAVS